MNDVLRDQLQRTLGAAFTLERELGGGGMSRVFIAEEAGLGRKVVVKVLAPELGAGVNVERFRREITLAAALQHPHIVPLLSAGAGEGMLYYTMPFIDGLSLRDRLGRGGELAIREATKILCEVADALAYAHRQGVVHRDIKPDNVLLSGGHAVVTDFGVAKALATTSAHSNVTSMGMALGTPAYMSPEQALADPTTDHRADIYAFGVLAFELLTGDTPFGHRSPQQLLVAHATEAPAHPATRRPSIPPALDALVIRCLEKRAADRPQTADELLHELEGIVTPSGGGTPSLATTYPAMPQATGGLAMPSGAGAMSVATGGDRWRLPTIVAGWLVVLGIVAVALWPKGPHRLTDVKRIVVAPFENQTGDASLAPVGSMVADWLTTSLVQTGLLDVADARTATIAREGAPGIDITGADGVEALAKATGAGTVVTGSYHRRGDSLEFQARIIDAASGRLIRALDPVRGPTTEPLRGIELFRQRLTGALAALFDPRLGAYAADVSQQLPSFPAYKEFMLGVELYSQARFPEAVVHLGLAVRTDTAFDAARMWLAGALANTGGENRPASVAIYRLLDTRRDRLSTLDRFVLDYRLATERRDYQGALAYAREAAKLWPDRWALAAAGSAIYVNRPAAAESLMATVDLTVGWMRRFESGWYQRGYAAHMLGRYEDELAIARQARAQFPDSPELLGSEFDALAALGRTAEISARLGELLAIPAAEGDAAPADGLLEVARVLRAHGHPDQSVALARAAEQWVGAHADSANPMRRLRIDALYLQEHFAEVRALCAEDLLRSPRVKFNHYCVGATAARLGDRATAEREIVALLTLADSTERGPNTTKMYRSQIAALLGDKERAMGYLRDAFATGAVYPAAEHTMDLESLREYPAYVEFQRPKG